MGLTACGGVTVRVAQIPVRDGLRTCVALAPVPSEALPPIAVDPAHRGAQIDERAFWMSRDLAQTANNREACMKQAELVALIDANNAGPEE